MAGWSIQRLYLSQPEGKCATVPLYGTCVVRISLLCLWGHERVWKQRYFKVVSQEGPIDKDGLFFFKQWSNKQSILERVISTIFGPAGDHQCDTAACKSKFQLSDSTFWFWLQLNSFNISLQKQTNTFDLFSVHGDLTVLMGHKNQLKPFHELNKKALKKKSYLLFYEVLLRGGIIDLELAS